MKDTGLYLIIGGVVLFILVFIGKIISFIVGNPILGLATLAIIIGVILILINMVKESREAENKKSYKEIDQ